MVGRAGKIMRCGCRVIILSVFLLEACYGTSIFLVVSKNGDYVVLASDSRLFDMKRQKPSNDACKVIALDDTLFFNAGHVQIEVSQGQPWDSIQTAREIYKTSKDHDAQSLSLARGNRAKSWLDGRTPLDLQRVADPDGGIVAGGFVDFDQHRNPVIFVQSIYLNSLTGHVFIQPSSYSKGDAPTLGIRLGDQLLKEFADAKTPRALKAYGRLKPLGFGNDLFYDIEFVGKADQFVVDYATGHDKVLVHGPINVVVLRRLGGIDWVARKHNCHAQDFHSPKETSAKKSPPRLRNSSTIGYTVLQRCPTPPALVPETPGGWHAEIVK